MHLQTLLVFCFLLALKRRSSLPEKRRVRIQKARRRRSWLVWILGGRPIIRRPRGSEPTDPCALTPPPPPPKQDPLLAAIPKIATDHQEDLLAGGLEFSPTLHKRDRGAPKVEAPSNPLPVRKLAASPPKGEDAPDGKGIQKIVDLYEKHVENGDRLSVANGESRLEAPGWSYQLQDERTIVFWPTEGYCLYKSLAAMCSLLGVPQVTNQWFYGASFSVANYWRQKVGDSKRCRLVTCRTGASTLHVGLEVNLQDHSADLEEEKPKPSGGDRPAYTGDATKKLTKLTRKVERKQQVLDRLEDKLTDLKKQAEKRIRPLNLMERVADKESLEGLRRKLTNRFRQALGDSPTCSHCSDAHQLAAAAAMVNAMRRGLLNQQLVAFCERLTTVCRNCALFAYPALLFDEPLFRKMEAMGLAKREERVVKLVGEDQLRGWFETCSKKLTAQGIIGTFFQNCPKILGFASSVTGGKPAEYFSRPTGDSEHGGSRTLANLYQAEALGNNRGVLYVDVQSKFINMLELIRDLFTFQPNYDAPAARPPRLRNNTPIGAGYFLYRQHTTEVDEHYIVRNEEAGRVREAELQALGIPVHLQTLSGTNPNMVSKTQGNFEFDDFETELERYLALHPEFTEVQFVFQDMHWYLDTRAWNRLFAALRHRGFIVNLTVIGMDFPDQDGIYFIGAEEGVVEVYQGVVSFYARGNGDPYVHPNVSPGLTKVDATSMTPYGGSDSINYCRWVGTNFSRKWKVSPSHVTQLPQVVNYLTKDFNIKEKLLVPQIRAELHKHLSARVITAAVVLAKFRQLLPLPWYFRWTVAHLFLTKVLYWGPVYHTTPPKEQLDELTEAVLLQGGAEEAYLAQVTAPRPVDPFLSSKTLRESFQNFLKVALVAGTVFSLLSRYYLVKDWTFQLFVFRLIYEFVVYVALVGYHDQAPSARDLIRTQADQLLLNGAYDFVHKDYSKREGLDRYLRGFGDRTPGYFLRKPKSEVQPINRENGTFVSATFYLRDKRVSEEEFLDAAEVHDQLNGQGSASAPLQTGFEFEDERGEVRSYAYDHKSVVNLLHAISNRIFRPLTGVDPEWRHRLRLTMTELLDELLPKVTDDFVSRFWSSPEELLEEKQGFDQGKKEVYEEAIRSQRNDEVLPTYYTGFVKACETYVNPPKVQGTVVFGDKKRARIVENRPAVAAAIPWLVANWLNATLGTLLPEYSYRATEEKLSKFLRERSEKNQVFTLSTDFCAMDSSVYHETQEEVERRLLRQLRPLLELRLAHFGFPTGAVARAFSWMLAPTKTTKFFTPLGKIILKRRGGRASGDPATTWGNTLTTILFYRTCNRAVGGDFGAKVSGDDLTVFSADFQRLQELQTTMLASSSRSPEDREQHSGFIITPEECRLDNGRATFCSKTLHVREAVVLPNLTNFYFNSRLYSGTNREILKRPEEHRLAVALSRLLAAGSSKLLQDYPQQLCRLFSEAAEVGVLSRRASNAGINYFKLFGDFWDDQEVHDDEVVDYLVAREALRERIDLSVLLESPEGNRKFTYSGSSESLSS